MLDDSLVKSELVELVQDLIDTEMEQEDKVVLPQCSFDELILNTPPPTLEQPLVLEQHQPQTPNSFDYIIDCFQTPKDRIIDWEQRCPEAPKQPNHCIQHYYQENDEIDLDEITFDWQSI